MSDKIKTEWYIEAPINHVKLHQNNKEKFEDGIALCQSVSQTI